MELRLDRGEALSRAGDTVVSGLFESSAGTSKFPRSLLAEDRATAGAASTAWRSGEIRGKRKELSIFHRAGDPGRVVLVGLGAPSAYSTETVRRASAEATKALQGKATRRLAFRAVSFAHSSLSAEAVVRAIVDGSGLGCYEFLRFKTGPSDGKITEISVALGGVPATETRQLGASFEEERQIVETVRWTRDIANLPAMAASPERLAAHARDLGREHGLRVTVYDEKGLTRLGCGGLLAVGGGSSRPPRLVLLEHPGRGRRPPTIAVVGK
ncbi:MAG: M17 family peptidase N-terminal domain-containing protein, partial [Thermoplasmata archaeon]